MLPNVSDWLYHAKESKEETYQNYIKKSLKKTYYDLSDNA